MDTERARSAAERLKAETVYMGDLLCLDITAPQHVEVRVDHARQRLWVNIGGLCVLRCCRIGRLDLALDSPWPPAA